jgi:hypothetical protein
MAGVSIRITVTVPELVLRSSFVREMIVQKMERKTAPDLKRMFGLTVQGWADKPDFSQKFVNNVSQVSTEVWPSGSNKAAIVYRIVNEGSKPHLIVPKSRNRRGLLIFKSGYTASTSPRVLSSGRNFRFGDTVRTPVVLHPGFEAREFDTTIAEQYAPIFAADMQDAIKVATVKRK